MGQRRNERRDHAVEYSEVQSVDEAKLAAGKCKIVLDRFGGIAGSDG